MAKEFKPPAKAATLEKKAKAADVQLPPVVKVGSVVLFRHRDEGDETQRSQPRELAGWIVQNSMCPGGQTRSYLVVAASPHIAIAYIGDERKPVSYPVAHRINHDQVIQVIEAELP